MVANRWNFVSSILLKSRLVRLIWNLKFWRLVSLDGEGVAHAWPPSIADPLKLCIWFWHNRKPRRYRHILLFGVHHHWISNSPYICMATGQGPRRTPGAFAVKRRRLSSFGHVCRRDTLPEIILQRTVYGSRRRGVRGKSWKDNIKEWTGQSMSSSLRIADDRSRWAVITAEASIGVPPTTPWNSFSRWNFV